MIPKYLIKRIAKYTLLLMPFLFLGRGSANALSLTAGWNLLGNGIAATIDVTSTFGDGATITSVWKWNSTGMRWALFLPALTPAAMASYAQDHGYDVLTGIAPKEGYWVNASVTAELTGPVANGVTLLEGDLQLGWNLVSGADGAPPSQLYQTLDPCLNESGKTILTAWAWDANTSKWKFYSPSLASQGGTVLSDFIAGKGYLLFDTALSEVEGVWLNIGVATASTGSCMPTVFTGGETDCVDSEVVGIVSFRGEGFAFSPTIESYATLPTPVPGGSPTQDELRNVVQEYFNANPYPCCSFSPNFEFSAEGAGVALFDWSPADFGGVALVDKAGGSILFAGQVIWMGSGEILYPSSWSVGNGIVYSDTAAAAPMPSEFVSLPSFLWVNPYLYDQTSGSRTLTEEETTAFSENAFTLLRKTDFLHDFAACGGYSVASYVYTPTVGLTSAEAARQLFLVRGRTTKRWQPGN